MRAPGLPPVHPAAWHGPIGAAVCKIAPTTEADPVAVLAQALALFGAMCGDGPHVEVGGARHPARIWPLIVGKTGSGRKGTSWAAVRAMGRRWGPYGAGYVKARLLSGLSSGEGLLHALGAGAATAGPDTEAQAPDGRLFAVETEFARVLAAARRDGSTLGPILRQMWEDGSAQIVTKGAPLKVDGAHLGMTAHVTPRELRLKTDEASLVGGTLNRFLFVYSERPHLLPHEPPRPDLSEEEEWLGQAVDQARSWGHQVRRDREADALWPEVYRALNVDDPDGPLGAVLTRGPAYTMRLALAYALADGSSSIHKPHLLAALAVWHYSAASARLVFTDPRTASDEDRLAAYIASAPQGRTRTEVYRAARNHLTAAELDTLLDQLERARLITRSIDDPTGGRAAHRYRWAGVERDPVLAILRSES